MLSTATAILAQINAPANTTGAFAGLGIFMLLFLFIGIALTVFWIWMIVEVATSNLEGGEKIAWLLIVILLGWVGALIYFLVKRSSGRGALA